GAQTRIIQMAQDERAGATVMRGGVEEENYHASPSNSPPAGVTSAHHVRRSMPPARVRTLPSPMQAFIAECAVAGRQGLQPPAAWGRTWKRPSRGSTASFGPTAFGSVGGSLVPRPGSKYA